MTTAERAKLIRTELKRRAGLTSRDVSVVSDVYSGGSSIRIAVKNPAVSTRFVKDIAEAHESIRRDHFGDILEGGNRFVFVNYSSAVMDVFRDRYLPAVTAAMALRDGERDTSLIPIGDTGYLVGLSQMGRLTLWHPDRGHQAEVFDAPNLAELLGTKIANDQGASVMTRAKKATGAPLWLLMSETREHGYFHVDGRVVTQRCEHGTVQPYGPDDTYSDGPLDSGLHLRCQGDEHSRQRAINGQGDAPVYGSDTTYRDVHHVGRREAVRMAKMLTDLDRKLDKLTDQRGYARSYGEYVGRVAEVLGCVGIAFTRTARSRETTGERWAWVSVGQGVTRINQQIAAWVDEARPAAEQPEAVAS